MQNATAEKITLKIYDALGRELAESVFTNDALRLNTSAFASGAYVAIANNGDNTYVKKFVVTH